MSPNESTEASEPMDIKTVKKELLLARLQLAASFTVTAAAGALGYQLYFSHGLVPALAAVGAIIAVAFVIEES